MENNQKKRGRFSPVVLILVILVCLIGCGNTKPNNNDNKTIANNSSLTEGKAAIGKGLPAGFEVFDEYRVFGKYDKPINGYDIKVMILPKYQTWRGSCRAIINFSNEDGSFKIVHDGWPDKNYYDEDGEVLIMPKDTVLTLSYEKPEVPTKNAFTMVNFATKPFFFYDIDFDGKEELLFTLYAQAQRWTNAYEVIEMEPDRLYSIYRKPPFTELDDMTIIDPINKTITLDEYEGHGESCHTVYSIKEGESYGLSPKITKEYVDNMWYWGIEGDTIPMFRRIYTYEQSDTTNWMPIKE